MALSNRSTQTTERAQPGGLTRRVDSRGHRGVANGRVSPQAADAKRRQRLLFLRYRRYGDFAARRELIEAFLPLARMLAKRYERRSEPSEDLVQVASLVLVKAIDRFDIERGNEFSSYAVPTILGELRRHFRDSGWALHVPRGMQERVLALGDAVEQLSADLGTSPTPGQIAEHLGVTTEEVLEAMAAAAAHDTVSLDAPLRPHHEGDDATIADGIGGLEDGFDLAENRSAIALGLKALHPRDRLILHLRFAEDLTQSEIAQRLGISQMHVSRLIRAALDKIRALVEEG